jgi:hypothetical protein
MWYFTIKQHDLKNKHNQYLHKTANLVEVEMFSEPFDNYCVFEFESEQYPDVMNYLDLEGITYEATTSRPRREDLLDRMK